MNIGRMRHRIAIQAKAATVDSYGEPIVSYATSTTVWGEITPLQGRELEVMTQTHGEVSHKVIMRYTTLTPEYRLLFGSRIFEINAVLNPQEKNEALVVMCKEVV